MAYTKEQREAKKANEINSEAQIIPTPKKIELRNIPSSATLWVYSNRFGELNYISKKTGYSVKWDEYKSRQEVSLEELITMKNTQRAFFEQNWILISNFTDREYEDEFSIEEILKFLQVDKYYDKYLCPEDIDSVFDMSVEEIQNRVPNMSSGIKASISIRANELIESGKLDSLSRIRAFETALGCELIIAP